MASAIKLSYHQRLFVLLLAFSWSMILCFAIFQTYREKQSKSEVLHAQLQTYNHHLLEDVDNEFDYTVNLDTYNHPFDDIRVTVLNFSGDVIYDNIIPLDSLDNHGNRPEIKEALRDGSGFSIGRKSDSDGRLYFYSATKGKRLIVRTAIPYTVSLQELLSADWAFLWAIFIFSIIMSVLAYLATRSLGRTIERLNDFAAKAGQGQPFDQQEPFPDDELGSISNHIVQLYAQWQQTIADRDREHASLIHQEQEKARIKRQLTNNINHELKTPVASMQGCLETLLSDIKLSDDQRRDLLERCYRNNDRLRRLLSDVSLITRIEDGSQLIQRESVCVNDLLNEMAAEMAPLLADNGITLRLAFPVPVVVSGNLSLLQSVFRNLVENAIAYSGGTFVSINLIGSDNGLYRFRVEDDGVGVDPDQLPRLFERFYRVDKGRSRQKGGTGLGLSIVKHAVLFHGGTIVVSNRPGGGLRFDFSLSAR